MAHNEVALLMALRAGRKFRLRRAGLLVGEIKGWRNQGLA
jgi:hypothetical protein